MGGRFLAVLGLVLFCVRAAAETCSAPVPTGQGPVTGKEASDAACAWLGIPFAAPPVGERRFRPPAPAPARAATLAATEFGPSCLQNESISSGGKSASMSEDCLTLNIFRPKKSGSFPVMFWIYGGGYTQGGSSYEIYDGTRLAGEREVVVVTANYRVGPFGFLALPELRQDDPAGTVGNYGLQDQVAALQWVRDNIAAFGGDPHNVTIFGESAGGVSVCSLLASPLAANLFHRAIMESGGCDLAESTAAGERAGRGLAEALGCQGPDARACLRQKPAREILRRSKKLSSSSHLDGVFLPGQPLDLIRAGKWNQVPVMAGSNREEMGIIFALIPGSALWSRRQVAGMIRKILPARGDELLAMYNFDDYRRPVQMLAALTGDAFGSRALALLQATSASQPSFWYRFDWDEERLGASLGAFHGLDIPFEFGTLEMKSSILGKLLPKRSLPGARVLSNAMMTYWSNFARTGNPNGPGVPAWEQFSGERPSRQVLDTGISAGPPPAAEMQRLQYLAGVAFSEFSTDTVK